MPLPVLAIDQVLTFLTGVTATEDLRNYVLSMVFANAAARASRKTASDPVAASQSFSQQWGQRLGQVGWIITSAGTLRITTSATGETATVADRIAQAAGPGNGATAALDALKAQAGGSDPATRLWWTAVTEGALMQGAIGQFNGGPDGLSLSLASFTLDGSKLLLPGEGIFHRRGVAPDLTTPEVLFAAVQTGSIDLTVSALTAVLQEDVFGGQAPDLERLVGAKLAEHFAAEPPTLLPGGAE